MRKNEQNTRKSRGKKGGKNRKIKTFWNPSIWWSECLIYLSGNDNIWQENNCTRLMTTSESGVIVMNCGLQQHIINIIVSNKQKIYFSSLPFTHYNSEFCRKKLLVQAYEKQHNCSILALFGTTDLNSSFPVSRCQYLSQR